MSDIAKRSKDGSLKIADDVLISMTKHAIKEVKGVYSLANISRKLSGIFFNRKKQTPVLINFNGDVITIDVGVNLKYGHKVIKVAEEIQNKVKEAIQSMTKIAVSKVNVYVMGVTFVEDHKA